MHEYHLNVGQDEGNKQHLIVIQSGVPISHDLLQVAGLLLDGGYGDTDFGTGDDDPLPPSSVLALAKAHVSVKEVRPLAESQPNTAIGTPEYSAAIERVIKDTKANIEANREADAYIDLLEQVQVTCRIGDPFLDQDDITIATQLEQRFGIRADLILSEFASEDAPSYTTWEMVMRAYDRQISTINAVQAIKETSQRIEQRLTQLGIPHDAKHGTWISYYTIGDAVIPKPGGMAASETVPHLIPAGGTQVLRSGACQYEYAICVSLQPFALVSPTGDMLWMATVKPEEFIKRPGPTPLHEKAKAMARWEEEQRPPPTPLGT